MPGMSGMAIVRPLLRGIVFARGEGRLSADHWARTYRDGDVSAEAIARAVADLARERDEIEILRNRPEAGAD